MITRMTRISLESFRILVNAYALCLSKGLPKRSTTKLITLLLLATPILSCSPKAVDLEAQNLVDNKATSTANQEAIIDEAFDSEVYRKEGIASTEWQEVLDSALAKDSTIAFLWQQKAMPLYKQGKYELGRPFLDKAVHYDRAKYQDYRAFMTCIFAKDYQEAILDFEDCIEQFGDSYVMDHSYSFYIALSKIQLHEFEEAEQLLRAEVERQVREKGAESVHHLDLFYLGISLLEQNNYEQAAVEFNRAIDIYAEFADAQLYRAIALNKSGNSDSAKSLQALAIENGKAGYTINEDNSVYERYPYQVRWHLY